MLGRHPAGIVGRFDADACPGHLLHHCCCSAAEPVDAVHDGRYQSDPPAQRRVDGAPGVLDPVALASQAVVDTGQADQGGQGTLLMPHLPMPQAGEMRPMSQRAQ